MLDDCVSTGEVLQDVCAWLTWVKLKKVVESRTVGPWHFFLFHSGLSLSAGWGHLAGISNTPHFATLHHAPASIVDPMHDMAGIRLVQLVTDLGQCIGWRGCNHPVAIWQYQQWLLPSLRLPWTSKTMSVKRSLADISNYKIDLSVHIVGWGQNWANSYVVAVERVSGLSCKLLAAILLLYFNRIHMVIFIFIFIYIYTQKRPLWGVYFQWVNYTFFDFFAKNSVRYCPHIFESA